MTRILAGFTASLVVLGLVSLTAISAVFPQWHLAERLAAKISNHQPAADSWAHMTIALERLVEAPQRPFYHTLFFQEHIKFIYPPASLLPMYALYRLGISPGALPEAMNRWLFLAPLITAGFVAAILSRATVAVSLATSSRTDHLLRNLLAFALTLAFYPVWKAYQLGQAQAWVNCFLTIALWGWQRRRWSIAGVLVGLCCLIKPQYALILTWGALRGRWRFAAVGAAVAASGVLLYGAIFGFADQIEYLNVLSYVSRHGETYHHNQSVNGLLNRLYFGADPFQMNSYPPFHPVVYIGTAISSLALILTALCWPYARGSRREDRGSATDLCLITVSVTMASPLAWEHHYGIFAAIFACLTPQLVRRRLFGELTLPYLAVAYILCGSMFGPLARLNDSVLNVLQSYRFFGAILVLIGLHRLLRTPPPEDDRRLTPSCAGP